MNGLYDSTQMQETIANWRLVPRNEMYIPMFEEVAAHLASKASIPYSPTSQHNFMHMKCMVCDDSVFTGSFNFSHSVTMNAENVLVIQNKAIADLYSAYIDQLIGEYGKPGGQST